MSTHSSAYRPDPARAKWDAVSQQLEEATPESKIILADTIRADTDKAFKVFTSMHLLETVRGSYSKDEEDFYHNASELLIKLP